MKSERPQHHLHIGKRIHEVITSQRYDVATLAHEIGCCRTNIYKICSRESIDSETLMRLSIALKHNFAAEIATEIDKMISTR